MKLVPLNGANLSHFEKRCAAVSESSNRKWGQMSVTQMLNHLRLLVELSLEERQLPDVSNWLSRTKFFQWAIIEIMPWPKGKIKAPLTLNDPTLKPFAEEKQLFELSMKRFAEAVDSKPGRITRSPMVGPISLEKWSRLHGKHLDHHLNQFGV